jgi:hypothetical protein
VPGEDGLEGFGGVVVMPVSGSFPGEHCISPRKRRSGCRRSLRWSQRNLL